MWKQRESLNEGNGGQLFPKTSIESHGDDKAASDWPPAQVSSSFKLNFKFTSSWQRERATIKLEKWSELTKQQVKKKAYFYIWIKDEIWKIINIKKE